MEKGAVKRKQYLTDFRFLVLTGKKGTKITADSGDRLHFSKISGIERTMDYEEIAEGGKNDGPHILTVPHKKHAPLVLEQGLVPAKSWFATLQPGMRLGAWMNIILLDGSGSMTSRMFWIEDGIVTKWETGGFDAMGNSILVERFEIVHDGIHYQ